MRKNFLGYFIVFAGVAFVVIIYRLFITGVNSTTVALSFLLVVQVAASVRGLGPGIVASILGVLCFNFFFLPPVGTWTIEDPQNWVALTVFLITAIIASQLSSAARARAYDAEKHREEVWKLYQLSRVIIATPDFETAISSIARQVMEIFDSEYCRIFIPAENGELTQLAVANRSEASELLATDFNIIKRVFGNGELIIIDPSIAEKVINNNTKTAQLIAYAPLKVGVKSTGVMVLISTKIERSAIEAIASLVALALERARFLQEVSRTEALRQSDRLKSALLASVSHNLRTPLTAIRTSVDSLLNEDFAWDKSTLREFHLIISEETYRLTRIVENLLEMARIDAGELYPLKQWNAVSEIISSTLDRCAAVVRDHEIIIEINESLPVVKVDSRLLAEVLTNLLENAAKYSPANSKIIIRGEIEKEQLIISVIDQGPGIAPDELERVFDKFYRGNRNSRLHTQGTGMGLAIARGIVEAHNGKIWVESRLEYGSTFKFAVPVEYKSMSELIPVEGEFYD
ncbi:MAG: ATP-binding protein [Acidobacteriota bacterium]